MKSLLFVCLGNICRSPGAEAVMNDYLKKSELDNKIICDSAGILGYHAGQKADKRMRKHTSNRGYRITSLSRKVDPKIDFEKFDMITWHGRPKYSRLKYVGKNGQKQAKDLPHGRFLYKIRL